MSVSDSCKRLYVTCIVFITQQNVYQKIECQFLMKLEFLKFLLKTSIDDAIQHYNPSKLID